MRSPRRRVLLALAGLLSALAGPAARAAPAQSLTWSGHWFAPGTQFVHGPYQSFDPDGGGPLPHRLYVARANNYHATQFHAGLAYWDGGAFRHVPGDYDNAILAFAVLDEDGIGPGREVLFVAGTFQAVAGIQTPLVARFDGESWSAVGGLSFGGRVESLLVHADAGGTARLYAGGRFQISGGPIVLVARLDPGGWTALGAGSWSPNAEVLALVEHEASPGTTSLFAGGHFTSAGGVAAANVARWNGSDWEPLGAGTDGDVAALASFHENGGPAVLVAGGGFLSAGGAPAGRIARWNGSSWSTLGGGFSSSSGDVVESLLAHDPDGPGPGPEVLLVGGGFTGYLDSQGILQPAPWTATWDGSAWSAMPSDLSGSVRAFGTFDDGTGERIWCAGPMFLAPTFGSEPHAHVWTGARWRPLGDGLESIVNALATWDDDGPGPHEPELFAGGQFTHVTSGPAFHVARWNGIDWLALGPQVFASTVRAMTPFDSDGAGPEPEKLWMAGDGPMATWDGAVLQPMWTSPTGNSIRGFAVYDDASGVGPQLYAAGSIDLPGNAENVARWDGATLVPVAGGVAAHQNEIPVLALEVFDEDGMGPLPPALFLAGSIRYAFQPPAQPVQPQNNLVRWDGTSWSLVGTSMTFDTAHDLAVFDFDGAGPDPARLCIAYDQSVSVWDGTSMTQLPGPIGGGWTRLAVFDDGVTGPALYAAVGAQAQILRWTGTAWLPCGGMLGGRVEAFASFHDTAAHLPALFAGGDFRYVDASAPVSPVVASTHVAAWVGTGASGAPTCLGDGSATACPCNNASLPGTASGCVHSLGVGGRLSCTGTPSLLPQQDTLTLTGTQMTSSFALYFQGTSPVNGGLGSVFGDGLRCAGGAVVRLATRLNVVGSSVYPESGEPSVSQRGLVTAPGTRIYQVWYRNAAAYCTSGTFNLTNAWTVSWTM